MENEKSVKKLNNSSVSANETKKSGKNGKNKQKFVFVAFFVLIIVVGIITYVTLTKNSGNKNVQVVHSDEEIKEKLGFGVAEIEDADTIAFIVENEKTGRTDYNKSVDSGANMKFTLRSSSSMEDMVIELEENWGTDITMIVVCKDESEVDVSANVSIDHNEIMKAEWYDNDLYYMMTTENLSSREDFLQEVNKVIIANHINFE